MEALEKLEVLADASRYDLSCACGTKKNGDHRQRSDTGMWLYPVSLPSGGTSIMLKTLLSNVCVNDCKYCPFRNNQDTRRCTLTPEEVAGIFMDYCRQLGLHGLFLSSGVIRDADHTMAKMNAVAEILRRRHKYKGYIHLKVLPGASDAAIEQSVNLANAVSLNVESPTRTAFAQLCNSKNFDNDIVRPIKLISKLTAKGMARSRVKQTTQFIVGAATETDTEIVTASSRLYNKLNMQRVYFSAYQRGLGDPSLPGETNFVLGADDLLTREHRLYQVDWLMRKYGFAAEEIPFHDDGQLSLTKDPKQVWAERHPEFFPLDVNGAEKEMLLRVPGLGPITVKRILNVRRNGGKVRRLGDIGKPTKLLRKAGTYLTF